MIITIHGNSSRYRGEYARRYPWPRLQLKQIRKHTPPGVRIMVCDNGLIAPHRAYFKAQPDVEYVHGKTLGEKVLFDVWKLRNRLVRMVWDECRYIVMLDSDAFPVRPGWLEHYIDMLEPECPLVAVQRLENGDTFSDRCFMVFASEAARQHDFDYAKSELDAGALIGQALERTCLRWRPLNRSNRWNPHPLVAGIYDDTIYHHGGGTRRPHFRMNRATFGYDPTFARREIDLHSALMHELHSRCHNLVERLLGRQPPIPEAELLAAGHAIVETYRHCMDLPEGV